MIYINFLGFVQDLQEFQYQDSMILIFILIQLNLMAQIILW